MKKKICALTFLVFALAAFSGCRKDNVSDEATAAGTEAVTEATQAQTTEEQTTATEAATQEAFTEYDRIDYAVFAKYLAYITTSDGLETRDMDTIQGCELSDTDQDGYPELYVNKTYNDYYLISYIVSPYNKPGILFDAQTGAAGDSQWMYSETEGIPYFQSSYSTAAFAVTNYCTWSFNTLNSKGEYVRETDSADVNNIFIKETAAWNNVTQENTYYEAEQKSIYKDWYENVESLNLRPLHNNYYDITTVETSDNMAAACQGVEDHLDKLGVSYVTAAYDFDENGENEQVYITRNYIESWLSNINNVPDIRDAVFGGMVPKGSVFIIVDSTDSGSSVYVDIRPEIENVKEINMDGLFTVIDQNGSSQVFTEFSPYDDSVLWYDYIYINNNQGDAAIQDSGDIGHGIDCFYGIFCYAATDMESAEQFAESMRAQGFNARVVLTTDWSELNPEPYYVVTADFYETLEDAEAALPGVQAIYNNAYIKYAGCNQTGI